MEAEIVISGNVGNNVEWRDHERFGGRAAFNVAVTPSVLREGEWRDQATMWFRVTCWRRLASTVRDSIRKGDAVVIGGRLRLDQWTDDKGDRREAYAVDAAWVSHDLRRGTSTFERSRLRQDPEDPFESEAETARLDAQEERDRAEPEALASIGAAAG